jgi:hypothetical protein
LIEAKEPKAGYGFIYILSNPAMQNLYKVGLTTNSVAQRSKELSSSTGVPKPFVPEKIFEVDASKLLDIEQLAHRKLKSKNRHFWKEFFEGQLPEDFVVEYYAFVTNHNEAEKQVHKCFESKRPKPPHFTRDLHDLIERRWRQNLYQERNLSEK